jgi:hypothetical protein
VAPPQGEKRKKKKKYVKTQSEKYAWTCYYGAWKMIESLVDKMTAIREEVKRVKEEKQEVPHHLTVQFNALLEEVSRLSKMECTICKEEKASEENPHGWITARCGHNPFCHRCADELSKPEQPKCPFCRKELIFLRGSSNSPKRIRVE